MPRQPRGLVATLGFTAMLLFLAACRQTTAVAPLDLPPDQRLPLAQPVARPRQNAPGAPVDCSVEATNRAQQTLLSATVRCELLDERGWPIAIGLGTIQNLQAGQTRQIRSVVYGVRSFSRARAVLTAASFQ
ncbi:MAG: hypothetical protein IT307_14860 [Chloroflexi bacterium]|nr:hypothetical protein [Chloroflexota bacterium]